MKVELLVSEWCPTCPAAERVWRAVAGEREVEFAVYDAAQPEGRAMAQRLRIRTIPAVAVDGVLKGVGVQSLEEARQMVEGAPLRARASPRHAGMMLSRDNRAFVVSAMGYLMLSGAWLLAHGTFLADDASRPVGVHLFTVGFLTSLIYGVGAHMLPRFTGNPIRSGALAWVQLALLHGGLWMLIAGAWTGANGAAAAGGALVWLTFVIQAARLWPVLWPRRAQRPV